MGKGVDAAQLAVWEAAEQIETEMGLQLQQGKQQLAMEEMENRSVSRTSSHRQKIGLLWQR